MKTPKATQLELPGFDTHVGYETHLRTKMPPGWYYVTALLKREMYALDDAGKVVWLPDDTVRYTPHLFATKCLAKQTANMYPLAIVKRYPWKREK